MEKKPPRHAYQDSIKTINKAQVNFIISVMI